ncbi:guanylate kinase, partial [Agromyces albus]
MPERVSVSPSAPPEVDRVAASRAAVAARRARAAVKADV